MAVKTYSELLLIIITSLFLMGFITLVSGVIVLISRSMGRDIRRITRQTSLLAQKGMVDNLSGLVGNASALLNAASQLVRTTAGIGVFLVCLGLIQMGAAIGLILFLTQG